MARQLDRRRGHDVFAALTPLLDHYAHRYGLSKSDAGVLVATYAAGALVSAFPAGFAATHWGPKAAVLAGIGLMAVSSLAFAFAGDAWTLGLSRFVQGIGRVLVVWRPLLARRGGTEGTAR